MLKGQKDIYWYYANLNFSICYQLSAISYQEEANHTLTC